MDDYYLIESLVRLLEIWENEMIFSKNFLDLLKLSIKPKVKFELLLNILRIDGNVKAESVEKRQWAAY